MIRNLAFTLFNIFRNNLNSCSMNNFINCHDSVRNVNAWKRIKSTCVALFILGQCFAQTSNESNDLPYYEIPEYPDKYTAGTVAARLVDGLGFRYYWATEGLRDEDLGFKPNEEARTILETIDHILGLSKVIVNATVKVVNEQDEGKELTFPELRKQTLMNIKKAADILRTCSDKDFYDFKIIFAGTQGNSEFPFWNNLNGPIADAIWHCGQIVSLRRSSGNPFNSKVSVFNGRLRN